MKNTTHFKAVNWIDGMKINKNHFISSDNFHIEQTHISRRVFLTENNFGILPSSDKNNYPFELKLILEADTIRITKFAFSLIFLDGTVISVSSDELAGNRVDSTGIKTKFKISEFTEKEFVLIVRGNPFNRIEYGEFESEDLPLRRPFSLPGFEFVLIPEKKAQSAFFGENFFILAKFSIQNADIIWDNEYIPPSTSLNSMPQLTSYHDFVYKTFLDMENRLLEAIRKYQSKVNDNFKETLGYVAGNLLQAISRMKFELKHMSLYQSPLNLLIYVKELANIIYQSLEIRSSIGKDRFLIEVNSITGIPKGEFELKLKEIMNLEYRHFSISESFGQAEIFLKLLMQIFNSMSEHDKVSKSAYDITIKR